MASEILTIGKLSDRTGVKIETIRYYEKIGLLPPAPRKQSGHRIYDSASVDRLCFIKRGRELGFSISNIRSLLGLEDEKPSCGQVYEITKMHLADIRSKIADLKRLEKTLSRVARECDRNAGPNCAIIEMLFA